MKKILTLSLSLLLSISCFAQKQRIELNLTKGQTYNQKMMVEMSIGQTVGEQQVDIKMTMDAKISYKVLNLLDSVYDLEVKYENLSMKMGLPTGDMTFSSEKEDINDMMSKMLSSMKNNPFNIKMAKSGKVIEVKNIDKLFNFDQFTQLTQAQKDQMKVQLAESYGEKNFRGNLESSMAIYPKNAVAKDDKWTINGKLENNVSANISTTYELKEVAPTYLLISGQSTINTLANKEVERNGLKMKYNLQGTMTSEIKIDHQTGWIMEAITKQAMNGQTEVQGDTKMTIPMSITSKITITDH